MSAVMARLACRYRGHRWQRVIGHRAPFAPLTEWTLCARCGREATR